MDFPFPEAGKARRRRQMICVGGILVVLLLITAGLTRLKPAAPSVERAEVWMDQVKRGEMVRQVRGHGVLVPEEILWISTVTQGRVERICVLPGAAVQASTVLVELSNPEVEKAVFDAAWQLRAAEAELTNLCVQLEAKRLDQQAIVASAQATYANAQLDAEANAALDQSGLVPRVLLEQSRTKAEQAAKLLAIEEERLQISAQAAGAQRAVQQAKVEQVRAQLELRRQQLESLRIRARIEGVLQKLGDGMPLQVGQELPPGTCVARVANPSRLKAEIRIYETQAKDVQLGQSTLIDTRNGVIPGHVVRIDPAVENGTVTVDVALDAPLPKGARPDLSVEGTIELERLENVLHVGKPVHGNADATLGLFRVSESGKEAVRVRVQLGRSSVSTIEIRDGLSAGDRVILSDMSKWDAHDRVRLQ